MTGAVAITNLVLGLAYCGYGVMTALEMRRDWESFGYSLFGTAWLCMAFTCGPHHVFHGVHLAFEGRQGGLLDLFAVLVGLPVGVIWLWLRVEAFAGGRGDRFIAGTPRWLKLAPALALGYVTTLGVAIAVVAMHRSTATPVHPGTAVVANFSLVVIYMAIGWLFLRTQLTNRPSMGGWSVSGLCLTAIFPTCALMHGVAAVYALTGQLHYDVHGTIIDWLSIPAGIFFLWVVHSLYNDARRDWNAGPSEVLVDAARLELADDSLLSPRTERVTA
jgi:hypothetical protein